MASSEQVKIILVSEDNASASIKDATQAIKDLGAESKKITKGSKKDWSGLGDLFGKVLPRNLQSLMRGFKGTQRQVGRLAKGFKALKAAWASIGIGLILIALEELISNWDTVSEAISGVTAEQKRQLKIEQDVQKELNKTKAELDSIRDTILDTSQPLKDRNAALADLAKILPEVADIDLEGDFLKPVTDSYDRLLLQQGMSIKKSNDQVRLEEALGELTIARADESVKQAKVDRDKANRNKTSGSFTSTNLTYLNNIKEKRIALEIEIDNLTKSQQDRASKQRVIDENKNKILKEQLAEQERINTAEKEQAEAEREAEAARKRRQQSRKADAEWLANERVRMAEDASLRIIEDDEARELKALEIQREKAQQELYDKKAELADFRLHQEEFEAAETEITERYAAERKAIEDQEKLDKAADDLELKTQLQTDQQNELDALAIFFEEKKLLTEKDSEDYKALVQQEADAVDGINTKYSNKATLDLKKEQNAKIASAVAYGNAVRGVVGSLGDLMEENSKEQKALAITEVLLAQAISIAQAIKAANTAGSNTGVAAPVVTPLLVIQMVGSVLAGFVGVKKILNEAGASGGGGGGGGVSSGSFGGGGGSSVASMAGNVQVPLPARLDSPDAMQAYVVQSQLDGQMQSQQNLEGQIVL